MRLVSGIAATAVAITAGEQSTCATVLNWNNAAGGLASTPGNWLRVQMPTSVDDVIFNLNNNYSVTWSALVATVDTHTYKRGVVTIFTTSPHTASTGFTVGDALGDVGGATLTTGTLIAPAGARIGNANGAGGVFNINDDDALFLANGALSDLYVANFGSASMSITGGGQATVSNDVFIGFGSSGIGVLTVSGFNAAPAVSSRLQTTNAGTGDITVGLTGDGTLNVLAGGQVDSASGIDIALNSTSNGTVTVGGMGLTNSTLNAAQDMDIGRNQTIVAAGIGLVEINDDGRVNIDGMTRVGDPNGGTGTLRIAGGILTTGSIAFDTSGNGILQMQDGILKIDSGTATFPTNNLEVDGAGPGDIPNVLFANGATATIPGIVRFGILRQGRLDVNGAGSQVTVDGDVSTIGHALGSAGAIVVEGGGVLDLDGVLIVGNSGVGTVILTGGGQVILGTCLAGFQASGNGHVQVIGNSSLLSTISSMVIGGTGTMAAGAGDLNIDNGGTVEVGAGFQLWSTGTLDINSGTLTVDDTASVEGPVTMSNGTINAAQVDIHNSDVSASGSINAPVNVTAAASTISANGTLTMGDPTDIDGFGNNGGLAVGPHSVTLLALDFVEASGGGDQLTIAGGTLTANHRFIHSGADVLSGNGTINGAFNNFGTITPLGTGLTFNGMLTGVGAGIAGTRINFGSTGGFTGAGVISADIDGEPGAVININGPSSLGRAGFPLGFNYDGTLHLNFQSVSLLDSNQADLGQLTTLGNGTLNANTLRLSPNDVLRGTGVVNGTLLNQNLGSVQPGNSAGVITLNGQYLQDQVGGRLEIEIGGIGAQQYDRLTVNGNATLGGTLRVSLINAFAPILNNQFTVLTANNIFGDFTAHQMQSPGPGLGWRVIDTGAAIILRVVLQCLGDANFDGVVNIDDLVIVITQWGAGSGDGDVNGNSTIDIDDLVLVITHWGACP